MSRYNSALPPAPLMNAPPQSIDPRTLLTRLLSDAVRRVAPEQAGAAITIERSRDERHGDFACNIALQLAKALRAKPRDIAQRVVESLPPSECLERAEIAGAGFINFFLRRAYKQAVVNRVLAAGNRYGWGATGTGGAVQVEFVSANPTGPLHVGHGRQAAPDWV